MRVLELHEPSSLVRALKLIGLPLELFGLDKHGVLDRAEARHELGQRGLVSIVADIPHKKCLQRCLIDSLGLCSSLCLPGLLSFLNLGLPFILDLLPLFSLLLQLLGYDDILSLLVSVF